MSDRPRVLVREEIADSGVELLRRHFDVDVGVDWSNGDLVERIGDYEGIVIRSATKLTADKKSTHFVQPVKEPIEEKKEKE